MTDVKKKKILKKTTTKTKPPEAARGAQQNSPFSLRGNFAHLKSPYFSRWPKGKRGSSAVSGNLN